MCDFLSDSSEGCLGSAVIQRGLSLAAAAACLPEDGRLREAPLKLGEEKHKPVTGRVGRETRGPGSRGRGTEGERGEEEEGEVRGLGREGQSHREQQGPEGKDMKTQAAKGKTERDRDRD